MLLLQKLTWTDLCAYARVYATVVYTTRMCTAYIYLGEDF